MGMNSFLVPGVSTEYALEKNIDVLIEMQVGEIWTEYHYRLAFCMREQLEEIKGNKKVTCI